LSSTYINHYPAHLLPNFGNAYTQGIPINIVPADQKLVPVHVNPYSSESDPGPYPIPDNAQVSTSNGKDHTLVVVQQGKCILWEAWHAHYSASSGWSAGQISKWNLTTGDLRLPYPRTSANEAGTPFLPGLITCNDMQAGVISHAINVAMNGSQEGFILPAEHYNSTKTNSALMPMGLRMRLNPSYDISGFTGQAHIIAVALKAYGLFMMNDSPQSFNFLGQGYTNCFNSSQLNQLTSIPNTAFQVVETGSIHQ
jgi:hypothetical protein